MINLTRTHAVGGQRGAVDVVLGDSNGTPLSSRTASEQTTRESKKKTEAKISAACDRAAGSLDSAPRPERARSRREGDVVTCCESDTEKQDKKGTHTAKEGRKQREAELRIRNLRRRGSFPENALNIHTSFTAETRPFDRGWKDGVLRDGHGLSNRLPLGATSKTEVLISPMRPSSSRSSVVEERKPRWRSTVEGYRDRRQTTDGIRKIFLMSDKLRHGANPSSIVLLCFQDVDFDFFLIPKCKYLSEQKPASRKTYGTVAIVVVCARNLLHSRPAVRNTRPNGRSDIPWFTVFGIGREKSASEAFGLHYLSSSFRLWTRTWIGLPNRRRSNVSLSNHCKARYVGKAAELIVRCVRKAVQPPQVKVAYCSARMKEYSETALVVPAIDDAGAKVHKVHIQQVFGEYWDNYVSCLHRAAHTGALRSGSGAAGGQWFSKRNFGVNDPLSYKNYTSHSKENISELE
ncbi:hypothetical protein B0H14DRAFT_2582367 [Mycena olivaceomarginata]|nr:hypothetical protein B0H14DRAFT_2582367 [Mycena olivaceomarginata]